MPFVGVPIAYATLAGGISHSSSKPLSFNFMQENIKKNFNRLNQAVLKSVGAANERQIVQNFTDVTVDILNANYGFSFFKDSTEKEFRLLYKDPRTPFEPTPPRTDGITQKAFDDKMPIYMSDYTQWDKLVSELKPYIKGFVAIPIAYKNTNYGTFNICYNNVHEFTDDEKDLCVLIGHSAAQAITIYRLLASEQAARLEAENQKSRFQALVENSYDIIALISPEGQILDMTPSAAKVSGYKSADLINKKITELVLEEDLPLLRSHSTEILQVPQSSKTLEFRFWHSDGSVRWLEATLVNMMDHPGVGSIVANLRDITERKFSEQTILHQAYHDSLTGLPNRKQFGIRVEQAIEAAKRHNRKMAIMFLDMDRFKSINDTLGHSVGDTVLKLAATRFKSCLRAEDTIARFGGDEFLILLNEIHSGGEAVKVAEKILKASSIPVQLGAHTFHPSVSIGIAIYPYDGHDTHELKKHADMALYRAKEKGRNCYSLYNPSSDTHASEKLALENDLRRALAENQVSLYYQPIVNLKTGKLMAMEALARWQHPVKGLLSPAEFIPLAEETGLILRFSEYALKATCRQYIDWEAMGFPQFRMAVNLSAQSFADSEFLEQLARILQESAMDAGNLEVEITESVAMSNLETTSHNLKQLKKMGVRISIDDFGTGYSSLSYLKRFPIHNLKIDRSFVRQCIVNEQDAGIVRTIVSMARTLNLKVIAEGVETDQQFNFLAGLGCDAAQGYYISPPMAPEAVAGWLEAKKLLPKKEPAQEPVKI